jgi:hypothetical protein
MNECPYCGEKIDDAAILCGCCKPEIGSQNGGAASALHEVEESCRSKLQVLSKGGSFRRELLQGGLMLAAAALAAGLAIVDWRYISFEDVGSTFLAPVTIPVLMFLKEAHPLPRFVFAGFCIAGLALAVKSFYCGLTSLRLPPVRFPCPSCGHEQEFSSRFTSEECNYVCSECYSFVLGPLADSVERSCDYCGRVFFSPCFEKTSACPSCGYSASAATTQCRSCGTDIVDRVFFCRDCGEWLAGDEEMDGLLVNVDILRLSHLACSAYLNKLASRMLKLMEGAGVDPQGVGNEQGPGTWISDVVPIVRQGALAVQWLHCSGDEDPRESRAHFATAVSLFKKKLASTSTQSVTRWYWNRILAAIDGAERAMALGAGDAYQIVLEPPMRSP